ncbi:MAG: type II CRISPR RNA-guided endonuclease Cas9, partial [Stenotrophobium sp.]
MAYRLGIDLGTASIGIAIIELDDHGQPLSAAPPAVRIFSEPLESAKTDGINPTKNKARGVARRTRWLVQRRSQRHKDLAAMSESLLGLNRAAIAPDNGQQIHALRAKAATERIELDDLLRVLLKMSKRRGYKGRFRSQVVGADEQNSKRKSGDAPKPKQIGPVETGINQLTELLRANRCDTLGQYLLHRYEHHQTLRLKNDGIYSHRDLLASEFSDIWDEQAKHHPELLDASVRKAFFDKLVGQLPLKSPEAMVGKCSLEPNLPRAPRAQPWAQ